MLYIENEMLYSENELIAGQIVAAIVLITCASPLAPGVLIKKYSIERRERFNVQVRVNLIEKLNFNERL